MSLQRTNGASRIQANVSTSVFDRSAEAGGAVLLDGSDGDALTDAGCVQQQGARPNNLTRRSLEEMEEYDVVDEEEGQGQIPFEFDVLEQLPGNIDDGLLALLEVDTD